MLRVAAAVLASAPLVPVWAQGLAEDRALRPAELGSLPGFDVSGVEFIDNLGDPDNQTRTYNLAVTLGHPSGTPIEVQTLAWDVVLTTITPSWAAEARMHFDIDRDGSPEFALTPGISDPFPVTQKRYADDFTLSSSTPPSRDGLIDIEFWDSSDDFPNSRDAFFDPGSLLVLQGRPPCNAADLDLPFGTLDLDDITAFVTSFTALDQHADLAPPVGTFDLADVVAFVTAFGAGCP
jgi:hypothetical protein